MWTAIKSFFLKLFGKSEPESAVEKPVAVAKPAAVPEEVLVEAISTPVPVEAVTEALEESSLGDPLKIDEKGRPIYRIRGHVYRFANKADAARFEASNSEATMTPDGLWRGLRVRPAVTDEGWLKCHIWNAATGMIGVPWIAVSIWIDPATKRIEWRDYPNQFRTSGVPSWYWIKDGVQNVDATTWNWSWVSNEMREDDLELERIKHYPSAKPSDFYRWPDKSRIAYNEGH